MALTNQARRQVEREAGAVLTSALPGLRPEARQIFVALLAKTAEGWRLFVRRDSARTGADAFLVGHNGVSAIVVSETAPAGEAVVRHAEGRCSGIRGPGAQALSPSSVHFVLVKPGGSASDKSNGAFRCLTAATLQKLFQRDLAHLTKRQVEAIADQLGTRLTGYEEMRVDAPESAPEQAGLLDAADLEEDHLTNAQEGTFESWRTFLHPHQQAVATRNYNGPARISGPAGTGKTVVALHRLRYLARRSTGPLLFTTFVRSLPPVHRNTFRRLAPELSERVEFVHQHAWAREFLNQRNVVVNLDRRSVSNARSSAWVEHRDSLAPLNPNPHYWNDEISRVIKGRGLTTFAEYAKVDRPGRVLRLHPSQKQLVWQFFETYQQKLADKGLHDYADVIELALAELRREPLVKPYAAVVVDEVQDITLSGLRMLNALAGEGQNRLLLVGDGQQQVYAGGWRLSDAGIAIQGRGEVLKVNYRNRDKVLSFAQGFDAKNHVDDLDGAAGVALRDAECANPGGTTRSWKGPEKEFADELLKVIRELPVPLGNAAVIVFQHNALERCKELLRRAKIAYQDLESYNGEHNDKLKIGTVLRAKGVEFQAVLAVHFAQSTVDDEELQGRQHLVAATRARDHLWWGVVRAQTSGGVRP
ncbi:UvrD-helicase domain-containing protein [Allokutzneria multivorans]|uniref:UvrD-helicase domain-containing protein n=1 Tax=Allokutzneria multivorans TaxID=1142134 RepID=A0ABP7S263_9PSEU